jgi:beta-glucanase (GH16 family)
MEWELIWSDEFDIAGLPDPDKWDYEVSGPLKNEAYELFQNYTASRIENTRCENSCLVLEARKEIYKGSLFTSASLFSKAAWRYVKIEVKAKLPKGVGIWPAIWMLPEGFNGEGWPSCGEIDIVEHIGQKPGEIFFNVNTGTYNIVLGTAKGKHLYCHDLYDEFHKYKIEWTEESIQFFMDDFLTFDFQKEKDDIEVWPFDKPFFLKLMLAVGLLNDFNDGGDKVDDSIFPAKMFIDYVRIYKYKKTNA